MKTQIERLLSAEEASVATGIPKEVISDWMKTKTISHYRLGKRTFRLKLSELLDFTNSKKLRPNDEQAISELRELARQTADLSRRMRDLAKSLEGKTAPNLLDRPSSKGEPRAKPQATLKTQIC